MSKKRASRTNIYFKIDEENRLIDFVRRYEELYDPRQRMRNMHVRKKIWTEIGVKLGRSGLYYEMKVFTWILSILNFKLLQLKIVTVQKNGNALNKII